ncbi:MAG: type VI secretion system baseplate subunit TssE [Burkholderiales bacterium]|jgi:type VI secretion system protein ImpF|nr:type VI secretion system baseplate subunit TssE [Burkholderiales bacterium]
MSAKGFEPSLFDKIFPREYGANYLVRRLSIEELKDSVAQDIESLLNTRMQFTEENLAKFKHCQRSILTYGVNDFSGKSLASFTDRTAICSSLEKAVERHEPRLKSVKVKLLVDTRATATLCFAITAVLNVGELYEPVAFDATLKPSTLQYAVSRSVFRSGHDEVRL